MAIVEEAYEQSMGLLRRATIDQGFIASPTFDHYSAIWGRDAAISCLGAVASGEDDLIATSRRTLITLADHRSELGQIPNAVWPDRGFWDWGEVASVDPTLWFIIAAARHIETTGDQGLLEELRPALREGWTWIRHQQANNSGLIDSVPAADWMDSSLNRAGKLLYSNVLAAFAAARLEALGLEVGAPGATALRRRVNLLFWPEPDLRLGELLDHVAYPLEAQLEFPHAATANALLEAAARDRSFYLSHVTLGHVLDRCDVLGNLLAVLTGLAPADRSDRVLDYLTERKVTEPYPTKSWLEPFVAGDSEGDLVDPDAERNQPERWRNPPNTYHNGGVWPFIGGFHVQALVERGRPDEGAVLLDRLAEVNAVGEWGFYEWLHGESGEPGGARAQTWNAATYVLAYQALRA